MQKMSLGDKLKFIVTGKKPEYREEEEIEKTGEVGKNEEVLEKAEKPKKTVSQSQKKEKTNSSAENVFETSEEASNKTPEEKFSAKTGMTLKQAEKMITKWEKSGEMEKCTKGASLIAEFFPEHPSKKFLKENPDPSTSLENRSENFAKKIADNPLSAVGISYSHNEENLPDENENDDTERLWSALSYIPFASIFVIITQHESKFTMYHAYQALALLFLSIAVGTFGYVLGFIGMGFVAGLIHFFVFIMSVFAGFTAFQGRYITIPFISGIAKTLSGRK